MPLFDLTNDEVELLKDCLQEAAINGLVGITKAKRIALEKKLDGAAIVPSNKQ